MVTCCLQITRDLIPRETTCASRAGILHTPSHCDGHAHVSLQKGNTMPTRSKAAVLVAPNAPLVIDDVTFPDPKPDKVLINFFASGICHSQLHQIHRTPQTAHRGTPAVYPSLLGHEATGVVVAKGYQVTHVQWHGQAVPAGPATWTEYTLLSE